MKLSEEQQAVVEAALQNKNIFIDACIGSGKTTTLNKVANALKNKKILYLTYNKLLKEDAKKTIHSRNTEIQNYHSLAFIQLKRNRLEYTHQRGIHDLIFYLKQEKIKFPKYDTILVDEYQDIDDSIAKLLLEIDKSQENLQWIFVGDMKQKIYDKTRIDVLNDCVFKLREDYIKLDLTQCFRINEKHGKTLSKLWSKNIKGVNELQTVDRIDFDEEVLTSILNEYKNEDILILTPFRNNILLNQFLNHLERTYPERYNKKNLFITISDKNDNNKPVKGSMIVTTFDGSKGLERKLSIIFGFDTGSLEYRSKHGNKEIIRNLFLVAASRGKEEIIFIKEPEKRMLTKRNFERSLIDRQISSNYKPSEMFDFSFDTDVEECYNQLEIREIKQDDDYEIETVRTDYNILLSPVIGIYQEAIFFDDWNYHRELEFLDGRKPIVKYIKKMQPETTEKEVLCLTAANTNLTRYATQAIEEFINPSNKKKLIQRLETHLNHHMETQIRADIRYDGIGIKGYIDTIKEDVIWELKFVEELERKHFLQTATYMYAKNKRKGILWNVRNNKMFEIKIKDRSKFIFNVIKTIKKI